MDSSIRERTALGRLKFIIVTTLGLIMFLYKWPIINQTLFAFAIATVQSLTQPIIKHVLILFLLANGIGALLVSGFKVSSFDRHPLFKRAFTCSKLRLIVNLMAPLIVLGSFFSELSYLNALSADVIAMCTTVFVFLTISKILLPMVSEFGLAEFIEEYLNSLMRPIFKLPGTSVMPILTSSFVSVTVAIMLLTDQFYKGYYTRREALFITTCLTLPAMPITLLLCDLDGIASMWGSFYMLIVVIVLILSIILIRIPPLSSKDNGYYVERQAPLPFDGNSTAGKFSRAMDSAAAKAMSPHDSVFKSLRDVLLNMASFMPFIVVIGTLSMFLIYKTPLIAWLTQPYALYLSLFHIPEAQTIAPVLFLNTVDIILPPVIIKHLSSEMTRFTAQLIFISQMTYMAPFLLTIAIDSLTRPLEILKISLLRIVLLVPLAVLAVNLFL
jgi:nucleoside recognition membrane protein YjiH